jgi:ribosomal protein L12E/L44/L45/RPP1/RPP2
MNYEMLLRNKLVSMFPDDNHRESAALILDGYGVEKHEPEPERVRLAILKLSGNDMNEIIKTTKSAKVDFRDVLAWAEYPRQSKKRPMPEGPNKQKLIEADREEYEQWVKA